MNPVAAVVVTYNRKQLLEHCIERLLGQKKVCCDILIVDNASTDGTASMVREKFGKDSRLLYENTGANLGGAGGFQYGAERALQRGYRYIWFMDDDTLPEEDALEKLLKADKRLKGEWGFLCGTAFWIDGSLCLANIPKKNIFSHVKGEEYGSEILSVKMASFVSLFVKREVIEDVGLPIGKYFIWTDDYEFTGRISKKYPCYLICASKVTHAMKVHARPDIGRDSIDRMDRYFYLYRNDVHCYRQYGIAGWCYIFLKDIYAVFNILIHSKTQRVKKAGVVLGGFIRGLKFCPTVKAVDEGKIGSVCTVYEHQDKDQK